MMSVIKTTYDQDGVISHVNQTYGTDVSGRPTDSGMHGEELYKSKIMIIDDEPIMLEIIQEFLHRGNYVSLHPVVDPRNAMKEILSVHPDLVLLDLQMPGVDGIDILKAIRIHPELARIPVVVLTAATDEEVKLRALNYGANDFLSKPVGSRELLIRVKNIVLAKAREDSLREAERQKRLHAERELSAADEIQSQLYPRRAPSGKGVDIAGAAYSACKGCGDYFDFFTLPNENIALVVGDVSGHGMASALRMVEARAYLHSLAKFQVDPSGILTELNQFMVSEAAYGQDGEGQFITMFFASIDLESRTMTYASAGHAAFLLRESGESIQFSGTGLPLGIADLPIEPGETIDLIREDKLLIPTDGIEEAMSNTGEQFGIERMLDVVRKYKHYSCQTIIESLYGTVQTFFAGTSQRDDITTILASFGDRPIQDPCRADDES